MITYSATLDVPRPLAQYLGRLLQAARRARGTRRGRRALTAFAQAVLVPRWFRQDTALTALARDAGISIATGYRGTCPRASTCPPPRLQNCPTCCAHASPPATPTSILDGILIPSDRVAETALGAKATPIHRWYSGKHRRFGANIQFVATADGFRCVSPTRCRAAPTI